jgi:hypothetical protein
MTHRGEPTKQDKEFINMLFTELAGIFPAWKQAFDGAESIRSAKRNWMLGLLDAGINSIQQVDAGLRKARKSINPFMPSVGQFISWCRVAPSEFGLPPAEFAWNEILVARRIGEFGEEPFKFSHGIILAARNDHRCDVFNWRLLPHEKGLRNFTVIYQEYLNRAMNGEAFELPVMIEDKKDRPVTQAECKAFAEKHLAGLKAAVK